MPRDDEQAQPGQTPEPDQVIALVRACEAGDRRAWNELVARYSGLVYAIARAHGLREDQCDDIAQSTFAALVRHLRTIRDPLALPAWLSQTTRRACWRVVEYERRSGFVQQTDNDDSGRNLAVLRSAQPDSQQALDVIASIESSHRVRLALDELGGKCRELLRALFVETDRPDYEAVSRRLSMPVGSIGPTRNRCLGKLAHLLEDAQG